MFLDLTPQTRLARKVVLQTPSKSLDLTKLPSRPQFACASPLTATLMNSPTSVANKGLTVGLTPLAATLTKNTGEGGRLGSRSSLLRSLRALFTLLHRSVRQVSQLQFFAHSFLKQPGVGVRFPFRSNSLPRIVTSLLPYTSAFLLTRGHSS